MFSDIEEALLTDILDVGILGTLAYLVIVRSSSLVVNVNPIKYDHPQYFSQVPVNV